MFFEWLDFFLWGLDGWTAAIGPGLGIAIGAGASLLGGAKSGKGAEDAAKTQAAALLQRAMFADPARLNEILFGTPAGTTTERRRISGQTGEDFDKQQGMQDLFRFLSGERTGRGSDFQPGSSFEDFEVEVPGKPGLVSQFRQGLTPALNANLGNLSRAVASGQSLIASNVARRRLGGTGIGEGMRSIGDVAPGIAGFNARQQFETDAFTQALNAAVSLMGAQAGVGVAAQPPTGQLGGGIASAGSTLGTYLASLGLQPTTTGTPSGVGAPTPPTVSSVIR